MTTYPCLSLKEQQRQLSSSLAEQGARVSGMGPATTYDPRDWIYAVLFPSRNMTEIMFLEISDSSRGSELIISEKIC